MLHRLWQTFWRRAPRTLKMRREGKVVVGVALAVGFAAINTGNNLLFLAWGMVLSAIVVSGVLSESTLRSVRLVALPVQQARAGDRCVVRVDLENRSRRFPAFGVELRLDLNTPRGAHAVEGPYQLRIEPRERRQLKAAWVPPVRGAYTVQGVRATTAYPFGLFEKTRRFVRPQPLQFWVAPPRVEVDALRVEVAARAGWAPARHMGFGEDYFSLRLYREGDDPRWVYWRRSARQGRWVVRENEALSAREVLLELHLPAERDPPNTNAEAAIATLGSLAEMLLRQGYRVGIWTAGVWLPPEAGERQVGRVMGALARLECEAPLPAAQISRGLLRVALVPQGGGRPDAADVVLPLGGRRDTPVRRPA